MSYVGGIGGANGRYAAQITTADDIAQRLVEAWRRQPNRTKIRAVLEVDGDGHLKMRLDNLAQTFYIEIYEEGN